MHLGCCTLLRVAFANRRPNAMWRSGCFGSFQHRRTFPRSNDTQPPPNHGFEFNNRPSVPLGSQPVFPNGNIFTMTGLLKG